MLFNDADVLTVKEIIAHTKLGILNLGDTNIRYKAVCQVTIFSSLW